MKLTTFLFCLLALTSFSAHSETLEYLPFTPISADLPHEQMNEVYGRISYSVQITSHRESAELSLESLLRDSISKAFGNDSGTYILAISVLSGGTEIAKKALVAFTWEENRFLFFKKNESVLSNVSFSGTLADHFPITNSNNRLQMKLSLQKSSALTLDIETYNKFSDQVALLSFDALQPAIEIASQLKLPLELMKSVIDTSSRADLSSDLEMQFLAQGGNAPNTVMFELRGPRTRTQKYNNGIDVTIAFETDHSMIGGSPEGDYSNVDLNTILPLATVGSSGAAIAFEDAIVSDKYAALKSDFTYLQDEGLSDAPSTSAFCRKLWRTLQDFFTSRDAAIIYAAYIREHKYLLNQESAKSRCVSHYSSTLEKLKIDPDRIL